MSGNIERRWAWASALHVENPAVGKFHVNGLHSGIELRQGQGNWLVASIPAPNIHEGWKIRSVLILYNIRGNIGLIDKIGIRNGHIEVHGFQNLTIGPNTSWELRKLDLPGPSSFAYGLGISIHVQVPATPDVTPPTQFLFTSVGLDFIK
jgi:hypothetical protein